MSEIKDDIKDVTLSIDEDGSIYAEGGVFEKGECACQLLIL